MAASTLQLNATPAPHGAALYLAVVQFFFAATWTIYVIFLPTLAESVGIRRELVIWILMLDQLVFAVMDTVMGIAADRFGRVLGRLGPAILAVTTISCLAFLLLPHVVGLGGGAAVGSSTLFLALTLIWTTTSSALRAPAWWLLYKYAATPSVPWLAALSLVGVGIAAAVAPYLGGVLRNLDPRLPFAVSSLTLLVTSAGLIWVERAIQAAADKVTSRAPDAAASPADAADAALGPRLGSQQNAFVVGTFLIGAGVLAFGYQTYIFFNAAPQYLRFAQPADLEKLLPVFWVGFNVLWIPAVYFIPRMGGFPVMVCSAAIGAMGTVVAALAPNLPLTIVGQLIAGGAWGTLLMAGLAAALTLGRTGREGFSMGLWFSAQAVAALLRMVIVAAELNKTSEFATAISWAPPVLWLAGGLLLVVLIARSREASQLLAAERRAL